MRVLVVEDDPSLSDILVGTFEGIGWEVDAAAGAIGAVVFLAANDYDLAVLDVMLPPPMDGIELARAVRASIAKDLPIILSTAMTLTQGLLDIADALGAPLLAKPWRKADLIDAVNAALANK